MRIIAADAAGFIGRRACGSFVLDKVTIDVLTYAGCEASLRAVDGKANHRLLKAYIGDHAAMGA